MPLSSGLPYSAAYRLISRRAHGKFEMAKRGRDDAMLASVHGSAGKVNRLGADVQVVSCHRYLVVFHPFVEQLTVFRTMYLWTRSSVDFCPQSSRPPSHHMRNCIMSGTCQKGT